MPVRQRFAVAILFGLGIIVSVAGVVRTWFIYRSLFNEYDQTWYAYPLWIAAAIEIDLGVVSSEDWGYEQHTDPLVRSARHCQYFGLCCRKYLSASLTHSPAASLSRNLPAIPPQDLDFHRPKTHDQHPTHPPCREDAD
jgi:hypothetical protein